ncbi:MAG: hypothetical protein L6Q97_07825 [Thermoanaerobaculia bacterium]|nr:hypothetical protein [Thermoanaerobaculia bacterium]
MGILQLFRCKQKSEFSIPITDESRRRLEACRKAIGRAEPFEALNELRNGDLRNKQYSFRAI